MKRNPKHRELKWDEKTRRPKPSKVYNKQKERRKSHATVEIDRLIVEEQDYAEFDEFDV